MDSEIKTVEQRLKSASDRMWNLERLVYKHKNQHRRCSHFRYILKVRRDLKLLKSANLDEVLESSFIVINGDRPKQKVQLWKVSILLCPCGYNLKRRKCSSGKYNFLERLLGVTRLCRRDSGVKNDEMNGLEASDTIPSAGMIADTNCVQDFSVQEKPVKSNIQS